eukprot:scaffold350_cov313-Prasinococcus_capsulatus_cf.AAC.1
MRRAAGVLRGPRALPPRTGRDGRACCPGAMPDARRSAESSVGQPASSNPPSRRPAARLLQCLQRWPLRPSAGVLLPSPGHTTRAGHTAEEAAQRDEVACDGAAATSLAAP